MAKVMIVDDSRIDRAILSRVLTYNGHKVLEVRNGVEAVDNYTSFSPDVVLLDMQMIRMSGIPALIKIKEIDAAAQVIMVTASAEKKDVMESIKQGALDYIVKPIKPLRLIAAVNSALESRAAEQPSDEAPVDSPNGDGVEAEVLEPDEIDEPGEDA